VLALFAFYFSTSVSESKHVKKSKHVKTSPKSKKEIIKNVQYFISVAAKTVFLRI
jgi:hypothetical protein